MEEDELQLLVTESDSSRLQRGGLIGLLVASIVLCVAAWIAR